MKKMIFRITITGFLLLLLLLFIFHLRYPIISQKVGNWSVGYNSSKTVLPGFDLNQDQIITYEYLDSIVPDPIDYLADPFFIKEDGVYYLFVELKGSDNANIALLTSNDGEKFHYQGIVLDESFHLSYPQVFKRRGEFFMIPESSGSNQVLLYKAENFPYDWEILDTLVKNRKLKDPTLLLTDSLNLMVGVDDNSKQFLFTSKSLRGNWNEIDHYSPKWGNETRPGGRFFETNGNWYLPIQNRKKGYGTGISLYKLTRNNGKINLESEKELFLKPQNAIPWFNRGMHHLDVQKDGVGYYMVYDGDRNNTGEKEIQYKRTVKFNLLDFYNFFIR